MACRTTKYRYVHAPLGIVACIFCTVISINVVGFWMLRRQDRYVIWVAVHLLGLKSFITLWFAICLRTD